MRNLIIQAHGGNDQSISRKFSSNDIAVAKSFTSKDNRWIESSTLWAAFPGENLLSLVKDDSMAIKAIQNHFKALYKVKA